MQPGCPSLADRLEDFLEQLELVRSEWVILDEVVGILELLEGHADVFERQLIFENLRVGPHQSDRGTT